MTFETFLITSRETLEAALVVGIVLAYLVKTGNERYKKSVWSGVAAGIGLSVLVAILFTTIAGGFEGFAEELFEGITMLIGAALLTTMILWMIKQRNIASELHGKVKKHLSHENDWFSHWGIFLLITVAILREGAETVIFLHAINFANGVNLVNGLLGVVVAIIVGYIFFTSFKKINLKRLFTISSVLLILFAAGLTAHGVHELQEAGVVPVIAEHIWDINPEVVVEGQYPALHEKGAIGGFLKGLFGYNGNPNLLEVVVWFLYLVIVGVVWRRMSAKTAKA